MKLLPIIFLFVSQLTFAQIGTSGGFQTPVQMSVSSTAAVLKSINHDFGLKFWVIKNISLINISKIKVEFRKQNDNLVLKITDDGVGFVINRTKKGIGLQNIKTRTIECEGTLEIKSKKDEGTSITITIPIKETQKPIA